MVTAIVAGDLPAVLSAVDSFEPLAAQDALAGLEYLGQLISRGVTLSDREMMRAELQAAHGPPEVVSAVCDIGNLLLVEPDASAAHSVIVSHAGWLHGSADDLWAAAVGELLFATARIIQHLRIDMSNLRSAVYPERPGP